MEPTHYVSEDKPGKFRIYPVPVVENIHFKGSLEACKRFKDVLEKSPKKPKK